MTTPDWATAQGPAPRPIDLVAASTAGSVGDPPAATARTVTATGVTTGVAVLSASTLRLLLAVTAISGTDASITFQVQTSRDNGANDAWRNVGAASAALTATGNTYETIAGLDRFVRLAYTVAGTAPSVTFTAAGETV